MQALPKLMETFVKEIKDNSNVVVISGLVFAYQAIKGEFPCTCEPQEKLCYGYMVFPVLILVALMLLTDAHFQRSLRYSCVIFSCDLCWVLTRGLSKALCVGGVWVATVLINADWYVCCNNQNDRTVAATQCKEKKDIMPGGEPVVTILEMKDNSKFYGLLLLLLLTFFGFTLPFWRTCCPKSCLGCKGCSREVDIYELILEVGEAMVAENQKKKLSEKLSLKMEEASGDWVDYLEVAEQLIDPWTQVSHPLVLSFSLSLCQMEVFL
ncbi:uncharacterized protein LOC117821855 isoform X1 [Notolabrus celidotus]|uniref:uncharacterized protein LOC117821855 isoform X1 n=1 Tax=Notolabrus celidotus TaxID=1203425 RepID=UPI00148FD9D8|nr:uncharacterized protein LOC117821855 isoform X1 [Notolabrus celidotus]